MCLSPIDCHSDKVFPLNAPSRVGAVTAFGAIRQIKLTSRPQSVEVRVEEKSIFGRRHVLFIFEVAPYAGGCAECAWAERIDMVEKALQDLIGTVFFRVGKDGDLFRSFEAGEHALFC